MKPPKNEPDEFKEGFEIFGESMRTVAERPEAFWAGQRARVSEIIRKPVRHSVLRPVLLWAPAAVVILLCFFLFVGKSKDPMPDLAAGADQSLLVEVEQALDRNYPEALAPAARIAREIDRGSVSTAQPVEKR